MPLSADRITFGWIWTGYAPLRSATPVSDRVDWSSTCTNELSELNARRDELLATGVAPYGISRDSPWSHVAWTQALDIEVPLLSDWTGDAVRALGITQEFRGLPDVARRAAFVVDESGIIRGAWRYGASEVSDFDMLVEAARSLS